MLRLNSLIILSLYHREIWNNGMEWPAPSTKFRILIHISPLKPQVLMPMSVAVNHNPKPS